MNNFGGMVTIYWAEYKRFEFTSGISNSTSQCRLITKQQEGWSGLSPTPDHKIAQGASAQ